MHAYTTLNWHRVFVCHGRTRESRKTGWSRSSTFCIRYAWKIYAPSHACILCNNILVEYIHPYTTCLNYICIHKHDGHARVCVCVCLSVCLLATERQQQTRATRAPTRAPCLCSFNINIWQVQRSKLNLLAHFRFFFSFRFQCARGSLWQHGGHESLW